MRMRVRENLIRSSRRQLETERRLLAGLLALSACLSADAERLSSDMKGSAPEATEERRQKLQRSIAEVELQIRRARSAVSAAFAELERHEIGSSGRARRRERGETRAPAPSPY